MGAGDAKKRRKRRICSDNVAAQAVSAVAPDVSCSASSAVVSLADGTCNMILVVIPLLSPHLFILNYECPLNTSVPHGSIQELLPFFFNNFLLGNLCHL